MSATDLRFRLRSSGLSYGLGFWGFRVLGFAGFWVLGLGVFGYGGFGFRGFGVQKVKGLVLDPGSGAMALQFQHG